jgi:hypothetical protein
MVVATLGSFGAIADDSMSINRFPHKIEPVLVRVDAHGKVTEASPAYALPAKMIRLLNANLGEMIRSPATDKHGKPISSQFIMNVALQAKPTDSDDYDAYFTYVSAKPIPPGSWYWVHLDGDRLALASQGSMYRHDQRMRVPVRHEHGGYRTYIRGSSQPMPAVQNPPPRTR